MDGAKNGVIYFSLGTYMKSDGMSKEMKQSLLKMFSKLDKIVIWKFESDMENPASNLHLVKWSPQPSILGTWNPPISIIWSKILTAFNDVIWIPLFDIKV